MNGRFQRGRARGGGAYRPYFYFRRNGRTIPAGPGGADSGEFRQPAPPGPYPVNRRRGGNRRGPTVPADAHNTSGMAPPLGDTSFLRSEHFVAPENAVKVQSIAVDCPVQCPGWRLYFDTEAYQAGSDIAKRIKLLETHYKNRPQYYDLTKIQSQRFFKLKAAQLIKDPLLMEQWPSALQDMHLQPCRTLATFGLAMHSVVTMAAIDASLSQQPCSLEFYTSRSGLRPKKIYVRPTGFMDVNLIARISSAHLDNLYCVRGTVTAVGRTDLAASWICYKCQRCQQEQAMKQTGHHTSRPYACKRTDCFAKAGFIEQRSSPYTRLKPQQRIRLAETHIQARLDFEAEQPKFLDVELRHDLVQSLAPGQEVIITGIPKLRPLSAEQQYKRSSTFLADKMDIYMRAVSIKDAKNVGHVFTSSDMEAISLITEEPDPFKLLVQSLAPQVHSQEMVKAGLLLSLFGGGGSQMTNENAIHVLLVGDPGIGKSHMLQMCCKLSEKGCIVSGKRGGASSSKLTASIQGRTNCCIEAGPIVSATKGHCGIDDIDRLVSHQDSLLQLMQSQTVSFPLTSIFANLQVPTAIVATANPTRGQYDCSRSVTENTRIHPGLLSKFHLVFVLRDIANKDLDTSFVEHIKALHAGTKKSSVIAERYASKTKRNNSLVSTDDDCSVNAKNYDLGKRLKLIVDSVLGEEELDLLPPALLNKFIAFSRQKVRPLLNQEAQEALKAFYMELKERSILEPSCSLINTSHLEGLIRLTQARARIDLSAKATGLHVRDALCVVRHSMADTTIMTRTESGTGGSQRGAARKFLQMLQQRSGAISSRIFDFEELKEIAKYAGITCGVKSLVDNLNLQGFLLKKGPDLYELMDD